MNTPTEILSDAMLASAGPAELLAIANDWLAEATRSRSQPNPNSMVLATSSSGGQPSARVVLCKEIVPQPGYVVFYTNYRSRKGRELAENPHAAIVMHWDHLGRQVRIEGLIERTPPRESDAYFASRHWESRVGAWASAQSEPIGSRAELLAAMGAVARRFGTPSPGSDVPAEAPEVLVPRPAHWGGYRLWAQSVELWVEGKARIHDRALWSRTLTQGSGGVYETGHWTVTRLQP